MPSRGFLAARARELGLGVTAAAGFGSEVLACWVGVLVGEGEWDWVHRTLMMHEPLQEGI